MWSKCGTSFKVTSQPSEVDRHVCNPQNLCERRVRSDLGASDGATVADRIGRRASRRGFQYLNAEISNRIIEVFCKITVTIVKYVFVPPFARSSKAALLARNQGEANITVMGSAATWSYYRTGNGVLKYGAKY
jgi:hypothetical protein